jgi:hypothetical protein
VGERVDEMMLGLEVDINTDEIQDDLTCRKAGWSFIQDPKNKLADTWEQLADTLRSSSFRGKPFIKGTDWQVDTCIAYLDAGIDLSKLTFAASHLSGGLVIVERIIINNMISLDDPSYLQPRRL